MDDSGIENIVKDSKELKKTLNLHGWGLYEIDEYEGVSQEEAQEYFRGRTYLISSFKLNKESTFEAKIRTRNNVPSLLSENGIMPFDEIYFGKYGAEIYDSFEDPETPLQIILESILVDTFNKCLFNYSVSWDPNQDTKRYLKN